MLNIEMFFDELDELYKNSERITLTYQRDNIFRGRQHSVSSFAEDLLAALFYDVLTPMFPETKLYFMVDYSIQPDNTGALLIPDIAIIAEKNTAILASYVDLKTDLGYKRDYFNSLPVVSTQIKRIRFAENIGRSTLDEKVISTMDTLFWRTVVISDKNISKDLLAKNKSKAELYGDHFKLYFLSGKKHPNRKERTNINIYNDVFNELITDIKTDIQTAISLITT